jgi:LytS/YehU family sensor histidine kinase
LRKLLESSVSDTISLKEEIEIITTYVEIEKQRFSSSFEFSVECEINHPQEVYIPFMMVQPFVENAIWHGLLPKKADRSLKIIFKDYDETRILCIVDDNGVGRHNTSKQKDPLKKKSLAIDFIKQRLEIIGKASGIKGELKIIDKIDEGGAGTRVEILIPKLT